MAQHVVIIGAGVIGLSSAIALQEAGFRVTIVARDLPAPFETIDPRAQIDYTSPWGGAHNRWVLPPPPSSTSDEKSAVADPYATAHLHRLALTTFARMDALAAAHPAGEPGITFMPGVEYLESPGPAHLALGDDEKRARDELGMQGFRLLRREEFPADGRVTWGCEYRTWCVNPPVYCCFLLRKFTFAGGKVVKRSVRDPAEVFTLAREELGEELGACAAVVNASGTGFGDKDVFVTRGQTCLVANPCAATVTRQNADGSWTFCVPRGFHGGTVIGGTKEPANWAATPDPAVRDRLLRDFAATWPAILSSSGDGKGEGEAKGTGGGEMTVLRDIVGRRPTRRGGPRIEGEVLPSGAGFVMHAYGLGGRGYELSWGVAEEVVKGVRGFLDGSKV